MKNRISHLLQDWNPELPAFGPLAQGEPRTQGEPGTEGEPDTGAELPAQGDPSVRENRPRQPYPMPPCVNMLMPVELCINRSLLVSLLSASIVEMGRQKRLEPGELSGRALAELEAAIRQQLAFRLWLREHPSSFVCVAMYPVSELDSLEDLDEMGDLPS